MHLTFVIVILPLERLVPREFIFLRIDPPAPQIPRSYGMNEFDEMKEIFCLTNNSFLTLLLGNVKRNGTDLLILA